MLDLDFHVEDAAILKYAAAPSLMFRIRIDNRGKPVRSMMLKTQIQILPNLRKYSEEEKTRLYELFGPPSHWANSLNTILWANTVELVPSFDETTTIELAVPCTYDFQVVTAKYFHGVEDGEVPLEFLFSGSVFYAGESGLQVEQISWDEEAKFRLPIRLWKDMMEHYFPGSAWVRVRRDVFDELYAYKAGRGLLNWDSAIEGLLALNHKEAGS